MSTSRSDAYFARSMRAFSTLLDACRNGALRRRKKVRLLARRGDGPPRPARAGAPAGAAPAGSHTAWPPRAPRASWCARSHARWLAQRELALGAALELAVQPLELALLRAGKLYRWVCKEKIHVGFAREMRAGLAARASNVLQVFLELLSLCVRAWRRQCACTLSGTHVKDTFC